MALSPSRAQTFPRRSQLKRIDTNSRPKISKLVPLDPRATVPMVATGKLAGLDGLADRGLPRQGILGRMRRNDTVRWSRPRDAGASVRRNFTNSSPCRNLGGLASASKSTPPFREPQAGGDYRRESQLMRVANRNGTGPFSSPLRRCATRRVQGPAEGPAAAKRGTARAASAIAAGRRARG